MSLILYLPSMNFVVDDDDIPEDDVIIFSILYSCVTVVFAMAVLSKFLTNEFRFGFRSALSLAVLFLGEPMCQFFVKGPFGIACFAFGCLLIYSILPASHLPASNKSVVITGMLLWRLWKSLELLYKYYVHLIYSSSMQFKFMYKKMQFS